MSVLPLEDGHAEYDKQLIARHNDQLTRALVAVKSRTTAAQDYDFLYDLQDTLSASASSPPSADLLGKLVGHLVQTRGDEPRMRHGLAEAMYSALRSDDRAIVAAMLDAGVDPNWQPGKETAFPSQAVMSLLTNGSPPCNLDTDEVLERLCMVARAGAFFQRAPDPAYPSPSPIAWPLSVPVEPTAYEIALIDKMIELEYQAGREVVMEDCLHELPFRARERVQARLAPILARTSADKMSASVSHPAPVHRGVSRL